MELNLKTQLSEDNPKNWIIHFYKDEYIPAIYFHHMQSIVIQRGLIVLFYEDGDKKKEIIDFIFPGKKLQPSVEIPNEKLPLLRGMALEYSEILIPD